MDTERTWRYGSLARPANGFVGVRVEVHPEFGFGVVALPKPVPRESAIALGLALIPSEADWVEMLPEMVERSCTAKSDGDLAWHIRCWPGAVTDDLNEMRRTFGLHATNDEILARLRAHLAAG